jgi:glycyl-tRNA synthetase beta chain
MSSALNTLLIELFTEELPPKALKTLGESFAQSVSQTLQKAGLLQATDAAKVQAYASPRRLAVSLPNVASRGQDQQKKEKLLPAAIGLDAKGQPLPPLVKKLQSLGLDPQQAMGQLTQENDGKQDVLFIALTVKGAELQQAAQEALETAVAKLPIPKVMRYSHVDATGRAQEVKFVRPAHRLIALYGDQVLPLQVLGLTAGRSTLGHRFHTQGAVEIPRADAYAEVLKDKGYVLASFQDRQQAILTGLGQAAQGDQVVMPQALLDEVTSLVEWPVVLQGTFDEAFLAVPQECLILTMQQNQKYFALTDAQGRLRNRFLVVANLASKDPSMVVAGNERVLRARLSDAKFFFDQDRKKPLIDRLSALEPVIYHNKIGSQRERIARLEHLAKAWAPVVGCDPSRAARAALLAKADLVTDMVGEFPELQGIIGQYYARHDQEPNEVAQAIADHYRPRFAGDDLPTHPVGLAVALADKLETIVGIWGIGLVPTGDKDPFALRRAALGVVRILIEKNLDLPLDQLLADTQAQFAGVANVQDQRVDIQAFIQDRARAYLRDQGFETAAIEAVLAECPNRLNQVPERLKALTQFMTTPEAQALCAANKRIGNILKKSSESIEAQGFDQALLSEPAEQALAKALSQVGPQAQTLSAKGDYANAMTGLSVLKEPVDQFFDTVMVNAEDPSVRANRLALLKALHQAMNQVADLSRLAA